MRYGLSSSAFDIIFFVLDLNNKTIVIAGATGGMGSSLSEKLSHEGARLILLGKSSDKLESLKKKLGKSHSYLHCDFEDNNQLREVVKNLKSKSQIDCLIHAAGVGVYKNLEEITEKEWNKTFSINVKSLFTLTQSLVTTLEKSELALVLAIGSGAGVIPMKGRSAYCSSKFSLRGFMLSLVEEFKDRKPHFCLITLGSTLTPFAGTSIEEKQKQFKAGRAYFPVEWVSNKLVETIKNEKREDEYVWYPGDYGFGRWKKP